MYKLVPASARVQLISSARVLPLRTYTRTRHITQAVKLTRQEFAFAFRAFNFFRDLPNLQCLLCGVPAWVRWCCFRVYWHGACVNCHNDACHAPVHAHAHANVYASRYSHSSLMVKRRWDCSSGVEIPQARTNNRSSKLTAQYHRGALQRNSDPATRGWCACIVTWVHMFDGRLPCGDTGTHSRPWPWASSLTSASE